MKYFVLMSVFFFGCLFSLQATTPKTKLQQQPKDCVKHPQIVKSHPIEKPKSTPDKVVKSVSSASRTNAVIPHFSVLNFINFFYSKDTLDNLQVM
jgi:hypothetical protein